LGKRDEFIRNGTFELGCSTQRECERHEEVASPLLFLGQESLFDFQQDKVLALA
jgi:hypothetical protein